MTAHDQSAAEYRAARETVGVIDCSELGMVEVGGRDRAKFLHALLSNDIASLGPGQGCAATLLDVHGKVQVVLIVWVLDDRIVLLTPPGLGESTVAALDHYLFAEKVVLTDASGQLALVMLVGPAADDAVVRHDLRTGRWRRIAVEHEAPQMTVHVTAVADAHDDLLAWIAALRVRDEALEWNLRQQHGRIHVCAEPRRARLDPK